MWLLCLETVWLKLWVEIMLKTVELQGLTAVRETTVRPGVRFLFWMCLEVPLYLVSSHQVKHCCLCSHCLIGCLCKAAATEAWGKLFSQGSAFSQDLCENASDWCCTWSRICLLHSSRTEQPTVFKSRFDFLRAVCLICSTLLPSQLLVT